MQLQYMKTGQGLKESSVGFHNSFDSAEFSAIHFMLSAQLTGVMWPIIGQLELSIVRTSLKESYKI